MIKIQPNSHKPNICILLTATIDPQGVVFMKRSNPVVRENDYIKALKRWKDMQQFSIVFCENSDYKIDKIKNIIEEYGKKKIEILQFDGQNFPREFGKGYGELLTIKYAIEHSYLIKHSDYVDSDIYVMADLKKNLIWADSRVFAFKSSFVVEYLMKFQNSLNDSKGFYLEHALARAVCHAISHGYKWVPLPSKPIIIGYSGTSDTAYRVSKVRWLASEAIHQFKNYLNRRY